MDSEKDREKRRQVGILGGTFDPVHNGHIMLADKIRQSMKLDQVIFVPCRIPPHKTDEIITAPEHRLAMTRLAASAKSGFDVSDIEIQTDGISYTFDTLSGIEKQYGAEADFYFIIGADSVFTIEGWYKAKALLKQFRFIVGNRPGYEEQKLFKQVRYLIEVHDAKMKIVVIPDTDISSTQIRHLAATGRTISKLVPEKVERYITEHGLYRSNSIPEGGQNV